MSLYNDGDTTHSILITISNPFMRNKFFSILFTRDDDADDGQSLSEFP